MENLMFNEYKNSLTKSSVEISEKEIIEKIRSGFRIKGKIEKIRTEILNNGKSDVSNKLKMELPAFIIAGRFSNGSRSKENLLSYHGWMIFDIDNIKSEEEFQKIFNKLKQNPFVRAVFRSPSGNGIKIIVVTDNKDSEKHTELYKKLRKYCESELNIKFDSTCDVNRLCFYSYDPDIYYNENSEIFEFENSEENFLEVQSNEIFETQFVKEMEYIIRFTNNVLKFEEGNRNSYIFLLGENCMGFGMNKKMVVEYCIMNYSEEEFSEYEIELILENSYSSKKYEFGQWKPRLNRDVKPMKVEKKEVGSTFKISIFEKFSSKLDSTFSKKYKDVLNQLKTERDKEMYILGMITTLESIYKTE